MGDENYTIVLDIKCPSGKIPKELESFFSYVSTEEIDEGDEFIKKIHQRVEEANHDAGVIEIMTLEEHAKMHEAFAFDRGLEQGLEQGFKQGHAEGEVAGETRGLLQGKIESARKMQAEGLDADFIKKITGLSPEEYAN